MGAPEGDKKKGCISIIYYIREAAVHREVEVVLILQRNNQLARTNRGGQGWMREASAQQKVKQGGGT